RLQIRDLLRFLRRHRPDVGASARGWEDMQKRGLGPAIWMLSTVILSAACAQRPDDSDGAIDESQAVTLRGPSVSLAEHHDTSPPLMLIVPAAPQQRVEREPKPVPLGPAG